jgi:hypothetical protein
MTRETRMHEPLSIVEHGSNEMLLTIAKNSDCDFDVGWYFLDEDKVETLNPVASAFGWVMTQEDGDVVADLALYVSIVDGVVLVRIPAAVTELMDVLDRGVWELFAVAAVSGEQKKLLGGPVRVREDV